MFESWQQFLLLLQKTDQWFFRLINRHLSWSGLDGLLPLWRTPEFWMPLYLFLLCFMLLNFGKKAFWWIFYFMATVSLMDLVGNKLIKQTVQRIRPCNDPAMTEDLVLRIPNCGTGYSFISNHAANHFAMAMFAFLTIGSLTGRWRWLFFVWALSIGWAQIYVGVHYPSDVLAGAVAGMILGGAMARVFNKRHQLRIFDTATTPSS
ncbi:MAG: phosphatase PAP2 family protein [Sphingomonadales bacterium]